MGLRIPILVPKGRKLRVVIYARYSTEEQDATSITDQFTSCRASLIDAGIKDADITELSDEEMSGELSSRHGINQVRDGVDDKLFDILLCEESSRLFRNQTACFELIETAVDNDIRAICFNDLIDTAEPDWDVRLHDAQRHHCEANRFTRLRIARKMQGLWKLGAAVGPLRTGYRRKPTTPATESDPAKGPFFDEIDPKWNTAIIELFERAANEDLPWSIGEWATKLGLPKCGNAKSPVWRDADVVAMVRRPIYRGVDEYRLTVQKRKRRSGQKRSVPNSPEEVWTRDMPHLRIVPDWLWYKANDAITKRRTRSSYVKGPEHPLTGLPRDSRDPLLNRCCDVCGGKMYGGGRNEGGYRCANAKRENAG